MRTAARVLPLACALVALPLAALAASGRHPPPARHPAPAGHARSCLPAPNVSCAGLPRDISMLDPICSDIAWHCPAGRAFSQFIGAVTGNCRDKGFAKLHGLDGITFGIMDFTCDNFREVFTAMRQRDSARFGHLMAPAGAPWTTGGVPADLADRMQRRALVCGTEGQGVLSAMNNILADATMRKAQLKVGLDWFNARIGPVSGRKAFTKVAIATMQNGLHARCATRANGDHGACTSPNLCSLTALRSGCSGDEAAQTLCMLQKYSQVSVRESGHTMGCRGGAQGAAAARCSYVLNQFGVAGSAALHVCRAHPGSSTPTAAMRVDFARPTSLDAVIACSSHWGDAIHYGAAARH